MAKCTGLYGTPEKIAADVHVLYFVDDDAFFINPADTDQSLAVVGSEKPAPRPVNMNIGGTTRRGNRRNDFQESRRRIYRECRKLAYTAH